MRSNSKPACYSIRGGRRTHSRACLYVGGPACRHTLTQSQVISWFRIQEMFRFQSFHMYGIIASAVLTAALALRIIKRFRIRSIYGQQLNVPTKAMGRPGPRHLLGGTLFGLGWALVGACPGPIYALIGNGVTVMIVALLGGLTGAWTYGLLQPRLPH